MKVKKTIQDTVARALVRVNISVEPESVTLEHPSDLSHGDYATSVALQYAKRAAKSPRDLAASLVDSLGSIDGVSKIDIAGPGFINFTLSPQTLAESLDEARTEEKWGSVHRLKQGQRVVVEYTDPNPFKAFHIGHLMSNTIGESIARLMMCAGAKVVRANYQGDLGVHVACAIWGMKKIGIHPESGDEFGTAYAAGAMAYKQDESAKKEIDEINKKLYDRSDDELNNLYDSGRAESLAAFEKIYRMLGTAFDRYFFESETAPVGKAIVLAHPDVFVESDGARVFKGEDYGLHTRVFINGQGLPTYEAKELGLAKMKSDEYPDASYVVVTANEINDYFRVIRQALMIVYPEIAEKLTHVSHGFMKLPTGKMSSRTGDVVTGESLLNELAEAAKARAAESRAENADKLAEEIAVAAIKYQILKQSSSKDIIFDRERALSLEGDSGPYLQYAYARTNAIIAKAREQGIEPVVDTSVEPNEVTRLLHRFPEIVEYAVNELEPHIVAQYLLQVASAFNSWYAQEQILDGSTSSPHKVAVTQAVNKTLKNGLWILGIPAPERM